MNNELSLKTKLEIELIEENKKLKRINSLLIKCIECIKTEASCIPATHDRKYMMDLCEGTLIYADAILNELEEKENEE